jgi:hypothetical protein
MHSHGSTQIKPLNSLAYLILTDNGVAVHLTAPVEMVQDLTRGGFSPGSFRRGFSAWDPLSLSELTPVTRPGLCYLYDGRNRARTCDLCDVNAVL